MIATVLRGYSPPWEGPERRQRHGLRLRVAQMSREELVKALLTDELTGLGNRRAWNERTPLKGETIVMIDADSLKWANEAYGHGVGDELLREIASLLRHLAITQGGETYRLGGDEFILVLPPGDRDGARLRRVTDRLVNFDDRVVGWEDVAGVAWALTGLTVTYGVGPTLIAADEALLQNKGLRQLTRLRAPRGERPVGLKVIRIEDEE